MDWLGTTDYAHRGLHDQSGQCPENSMPAIEEAMDHGYGLEIDIQRSVDNEAIVFHDLSLKRQTGRKGLLANKQSHELKKMRFTGSSITIPTLKQVLDFVNGRVPLLLDIKTSPGILGLLEKRVAGLLRHYRGPVAVMSWTPASLELLAFLISDIPCGQIVSRISKQKKPGNLQRIQQMLKPRFGLNSSTDRRFMACDFNGLRKQEALDLKEDKTPLLTWTVRSQEQAQLVRDTTDAIIFEGFRP